MIITRTSMATGKTHTMDLPISQEKLDSWEKGKGLIQDIFPELTADQREFLITGMTQEEWDDLFEGCE